MTNNHCDTGLEMAVIGMAGRFPGAKDIDQFWENLKNGVESINFYSDEELLEAGVDPDILKNPDYVKCGGGALEDKEYFDSSFFGYSPSEAELMDPQMRVFHECAWTALENAGYDPFSYDGLIGLYAGASFNLNWELLSLLSGRTDVLEGFATRMLIDRDRLCTRISYKLNLKGPSVIVKTACSTSLVAVHVACQAILNGECDMALAGGVTITKLKKSGYMHREGMIFSPDGHCRAFDAQAQGTNDSDGVGIVVLKRLEEAIRDNDYIHAVIKGTAINNDGVRKTGYTAPSIEGQCEVICDAQQIADVDPETISYVETHGTGTPVGDPIEIEALKMAFDTDKKGFCRIGSVKTNIGHVDSAAGVAGLIKTIFILKHKLIPPSLNFEAPNPRIDFENSPFYVNTELSQWKSNGYPFRAGVSSFGIGGTNAHAVLEEWSDHLSSKIEQGTRAPKRKHQLILLSAKTQSALDKMTENLAEYFKQNLLNRGNRENPINPGQILADASYTLHVGRKAFPYRRTVVCSDVDSAIEALSVKETGKTRTFHAAEEKKSVIFMFPGLGSQYVNMGLGLYQEEPVFREEMDRCFEILNNLLDYDIKEILYPGNAPRGTSTPAAPALNSKPPGIHHIEISQVVIFILGYALAKLLMKWGIKPHAMIGYSFGEYTAACLAGVFSLKDALKLITARGKLISGIPPGTMLSVPLPPEEVKPLLTDELSIAVDNGPSCIISGPGKAVGEFQKKLKEKRHLCMPLSTSHAIHSKMMNPILKEFEQFLEKIELSKPQIPYVSNVTGQWITVQDAVNPGYWLKHLNEVVRFADGIEVLKKESNTVFIEIGPGRDLSTLLVRHREEENNSPPLAVNLIRVPQQEFADDYYLLNAIGQLWLFGVNIDWKEFYTGEQRRRIPLPSYPFDGQRYWFDADFSGIGQQMLLENSLTREKTDMEDWFYTSQWVRSTLPTGTNTLQHKKCWLLFTDESKLGNRLALQLKKNKHHVIMVRAGIKFEESGADEYTVNSRHPEDFDTLFKELGAAGKIPGNIVHLWCFSGSSQQKTTLEELDRIQDLGLYSLLNIARAIGKNTILDDMQLGVITDNIQYVTGEEELSPAKSTILGAVKIIPLEYSNISCRSIDIINPGKNMKKMDFIIDNLLREFSAGFSEHQVVAYRGACRWKEHYEPVRLNQDTPIGCRLKEKGVYLITGGFGGMGFAIAENLVKTFNARLILVDILDFPGKEGQDQWLTSEDRKKDIRLKKQNIKEWDEFEAEVHIHNADVSNYQQMKEVISKAETCFGKIDGVIHTAGLIDYAGIIQNRTKEMTENHLAAKVKGTLILDELLKDHQLDFMVLFSSIGNIFYNLRFGQVGSNAGHEFLDVFSYYKQKDGLFTVTIDWNNWTEIGMAARASSKIKDFPNKSETNPAYDALMTISPSEGIKVFNRVLNHNLSRVIVSSRDLEGMLQYINRSKNEDTENIIGLLDANKSYERLYDRPELSSAYVPPSDKIQQSIVDNWKRLFGIKRIGIEDDFFELGGDSLMATTMVTGIHQELGLRIPLVEVFNMRTIKKLAGYIRSKENRNLNVIEEATVLLKEGSDRDLHLFFIHDGTGEIEIYVELSNHLNTTFNFWGIKADRNEVLSPQNIRFEDIARAHVVKIQSVQPKGPYYIAGHCTGGLMAFEIARQLEKLDEEVKFLGIIDTPAPQGASDCEEFSIETEISVLSEYFPRDEIMKKAVDISDLEQFWNIILDYLEEPQMGIEKVRQFVPGGLVESIPNFDQKSIKELTCYINRFRSFINAELSYFPDQDNNIPTYLFEAIDSYLRTADIKLHWDDFSSNAVTSYDVPGNHDTALRMPNVVELAKIFDNSLQSVLKR